MIEINNYTIYSHCVPSEISKNNNPKYYFGITKRSVKERWRHGNGYKNNLHFYRAITKYGWDNIIHKIIATNLTKEEACEMEKMLIKEYKSNNYHYGYNITAGGEGSFGLSGELNPNFGRKWNDEQKKAMSNKKKAMHLTMSDENKIKHSEYIKRKWENPEYRKSMSGINAPTYGRTGDKHPMYGKHGSNAKMVICLNTGVIYNSAIEASKILKINHSKLCMCCRGERKSCGKDEFGKPLYWDYYNPQIIEKIS